MISAGVWGLWFASVQVGGIVLWLISRIDMKKKMNFKQQISCQMSKDIALFRDCLRYCAGASLSQGKSFSFICVLAFAWIIKKCCSTG